MSDDGSKTGDDGGDDGASDGGDDGANDGAGDDGASDGAGEFEMSGVIERAGVNDETRLAANGLDAHGGGGGQS